MAFLIPESPKYSRHRVCRVSILGILVRALARCLIYAVAWSLMGRPKEDDINTRILHAGSKARDTGYSRNHGLIGSSSSLHHISYIPSSHLVILYYSAYHVRIPMFMRWLWSPTKGGPEESPWELPLPKQAAST